MDMKYLSIQWINENIFMLYYHHYVRMLEMKIVKIALAPVLVFSIIGGVKCELYQVIMPPFTPETIVWLNLFLGVVGWGLLGVELLVMFKIGKKLDFRKDLVSIIVSLFLGSFVGYYIGIAAMLPIICLRATYISPNFQLTYMLVNLYPTVGYAISELFKTFTPASIAYLKTKQ